jgi:diaminopimelate epimerase
MYFYIGCSLQQHNRDPKQYHNAAGAHTHVIVTWAVKGRVRVQGAQICVRRDGAVIAASAAAAAIAAAVASAAQQQRQRPVTVVTWRGDMQLSDQAQSKTGTHQHFAVVMRWYTRSTHTKYNCQAGCARVHAHTRMMRTS